MYNVGRLELNLKKKRNPSPLCYCASEAAVKLLSVMQYAKYVKITTAGVNQLWLASAQPQRHTHKCTKSMLTNRHMPPPPWAKIQSHLKHICFPSNDCWVSTALASASDHVWSSQGGRNKPLTERVTQKIGLLWQGGGVGKTQRYLYFLCEIGILLNTL